jgi:integrase/recombinase XerD
LKLKGLRASSVNHTLNILKAFYEWLRRSNSYPMTKPLPTDTIGLKHQLEPKADYTDEDELAQIWQVLEFEEKTAVRDAFGTRVRDRTIVAVLSHRLRV